MSISFHPSSPPVPAIFFLSLLTLETQLDSLGLFCREKEKAAVLTKS
jgi:hypothetical protein